MCRQILESMRLLQLTNPQIIQIYTDCRPPDRWGFCIYTISFPGSARERAVWQVPPADNFIKRVSLIRGRASKAVRSQAKPGKETRDELWIYASFSRLSVERLDCRPIIAAATTNGATANTTSHCARGTRNTATC